MLSKDCFLHDQGLITHYILIVLLSYYIRSIDFKLHVNFLFHL